MKINQVRFHGFGHWVDQEFSFYPGINLIEAPNESGKSTLIQGLFALLYGRNKEGNYKKRQKAAWFDQYIPWHEKQFYGGEIDYVIGDESYRLNRSFYDDDHQLIRWKTGEDITTNFPMDQKKERQFLEQQIGLSGRLIQRICMVHSLSFVDQGKEKQLGDRELVFKLSSLLRQGEEMDIQPALQYLQSEIQRIGHANQMASTPYGRVSKRIAELKKQIEQLQSLRHQIEVEEQKIAEWSHEESLLHNQLITLKRLISYEQAMMEWEHLQLQKQALREKFDHYDDLERREQELERKKQSIDLPESMTTEDLEETLQVIQKKDYLDRQLREIQEQQRVCNEQITRFKEENYLMIQMDLAQAQRMLTSLDQYQELEANIDDMHEQLMDEQQKLNQVDLDIDELKELTFTRKQVDPKERWWVRMGWLFGLTSLISLFFAPVVSAILLLLAGGSVAWYIRSKHIKKQENHQRQHQILTRWEVDSIFELYRKKDAMNETIKQCNNKHLEQQLEQIRQQVKQWISTYQNQMEPFDLQTWREIVSTYMQKAKEKKKWLQSRESRLEYFDEQKEQIQDQITHVSHELQQYRDQWGTYKFQTLQRWRNQLNLRQHLCHLIEGIQEERVQMQQTMISENWKHRLKQTIHNLGKLTLRMHGTCCQLKEKIYLDVNLHKALRSKEEQFAELKKKSAKCKGNLEVRYEQLEDLADLETELQKEQVKQAEMDKEKELIQEAMDTMKAAQKEVEEDIAPQLKPVVSKWIAKITSDRYQECHVFPDRGFSLSCFEKKQGKQIPISVLSRGTIDQMYFVLRLAMIQFYSEKTQGYNDLPIFLDDSFVQFDDHRLRKTLWILQQFAHQHQIFLCTCQSRERKMLEEAKIPYHFIHLQKAAVS